jgi:hypothetical protein
MGHQFFLTTHSNHLLDLLEDNALVSIFSFSEITDERTSRVDSSQADSHAGSEPSKPAPRFRIRASTLTDRRTLMELGVRPSATFLANATIWVEGVSDCAYLRAYMEAFVHYLKRRGGDWGETLAQRLGQYKEDRHYAFVEYSGANLTHFSFEDELCDDDTAEARPKRVTSVPNLCAKAIVIADGDIANGNKGDRLKNFADQLKGRIIMTPGKEIENLIPEVLMQKQVRRDNSGIDSESPELVDQICYKDYSRMKAGVGSYLANLGFVTPKVKCKYNDSQKGSIDNDEGSSGTLTSHMKRKWASDVAGIPSLVRQAVDGDMEHTISSDLPGHLTQDLIWLCVRLYAHIAECNHDTEATRKLKNFRKFIQEQEKELQVPSRASSGDTQHSPQSVDPASFAALEWPIHDVENRNCLLKSYLEYLSHSQPKPVPTSAALSATASLS